MRALHRVAFRCASLSSACSPCSSPGAPTPNSWIREPFNPPPDTQNNFLGYFTTSDQQTTCGNCHVMHQADWAPDRARQRLCRR